MKKKLLLIFTVILSSVALAACGKDEEPAETAEIKSLKLYGLEMEKKVQDIKFAEGSRGEFVSHYFDGFEELYDDILKSSTLDKKAKVDLKAIDYQVDVIYEDGSRELIYFWLDKEKNNKLYLQNSTLENITFVIKDKEKAETLYETFRSLYFLDGPVFGKTSNNKSSENGEKTVKNEDSEEKDTPKEIPLLNLDNESDNVNTDEEFKVSNYYEEENSSTTNSKENKNTTIDKKNNKEPEQAVKDVEKNMKELQKILEEMNK